MHPNDGQLRAFLDDALTQSVHTTLAEHLARCPDCRQRADELAARGARIHAQFSNLSRVETSPNTKIALDRFYARYNSKKENPMLNKIFGRQLRPVWAITAVIALLVASMTFAPVRAWAGQFLGLFRVQQVQVIQIDPTLLNNLNGDTAFGKQISQLLSETTTVLKEPGQPQPVHNVAEASQRAGFAVRLPTSRTDKLALTVSDSSAFQFVIDRKLAQDVLNQSGHSDLQLPASVDGATIKVNIPAAVTAEYGDCPNPENLANEKSNGGSPGRKFINCVMVAQIPSPTVDTPPDLDVQKLAEIGLQFTGMKAEDARAYAQTVDWTSTLVIPLPRNAAQYKKMTVDGANGYLIQRPLDDAPQYTLIWVKNGIIYAIGGMGNDSAAAIEMANSMK